MNVFMFYAPGIGTKLPNSNTETINIILLRKDELIND